MTDNIHWTRSTHCGANKACIYVAAWQGDQWRTVGFRDSKIDGGVGSPVLKFSPAEATRFLNSIKSGNIRRGDVIIGA